MLLKKQWYYPLVGTLIADLSIACFSILLSFSLDVVEVTKKVAPKIAAANKIALIFIMYRV